MPISSARLAPDAINAFRSIAITYLLLFCTACGGGGSGTQSPSSSNDSSGSTPSGSDGNVMPVLSVRTDLDLGFTGRYLLGLHFVYSDEKDAIYRDDAIAN